MSRKNNGLKKLAIGSALAAIAGYIAGLLTAPKSGKESRKDITDTAAKSWHETENEVKKISSELTKAIKLADNKKDKLADKTQKDMKRVLENAQDNKEKLREIISAIHEGDADDHDLKRAVQDARRALDHLKDFLSKS